MFITCSLLLKLFQKTRLEHFELCKNQQCPVRLRILLKKTVLCQYWKEGRCHKSIDGCSYAHGEKDIKPLPKYELCQKNLRKQCNLEYNEVSNKVPDLHYSERLCYQYIGSTLYVYVSSGMPRRCQWQLEFQKFFVTFLFDYWSIIHLFNYVL